MTVSNKSLTSKQLDILKVLYNFRFATAELLALNLNLKNNTLIYERLRILVNLEYIGRNYQTSYKLQGKPAIYYLLPKSLPILKKQEGISSVVLKNINKDSKASDRFINHSIAIYITYIALRKRLKENLWFFTSSNLKFPEYNYLPKPLPDAYLSIKFNNSNRSKRKHFFLIYCASSVPLFVHLRRLKSLIDYIDAGDWEDATNTVLSGLLVLTDITKFKQLLIEKMAQLLYNEGHEEDISYFITTLDQLDHMEELDNAIWQSISVPTIVRSLEKI